MNSEKISSLLESWLNEDSASNDVTTHLIGSNKNAKFIVTGGPGVLSGISIANHLMSKADLTCNFLKSDGEIISSNENIAYISGDFNFILSRERLFLNLLSTDQTYIMKYDQKQMPLRRSSSSLNKIAGSLESYIALVEKKLKSLQKHLKSMVLMPDLIMLAWNSK